MNREPYGLSFEATELTHSNPNGEVSRKEHKERIEKACWQTFRVAGLDTGQTGVSLFDSAGCYHVKA